MVMMKTVRSFSAVACATALVACSRPVADYCDPETPCDDPAKPFCDVNGQYESSEFIGNTCIPYPWDAGASDETDARTGSADATTVCAPSTIHCENDTMIVCDANGLVESQAECELGCHPTDDRCNVLAPANGFAADFDVAVGAPNLTLSDGATINTTTGEIRNGGGQLLSVSFANYDDGLPVGVHVVRVGSLTVGDLTVSGRDRKSVV